MIRSAYAVNTDNALSFHMYACVISINMEARVAGSSVFKSIRLDLGLTITVHYSSPAQKDGASIPENQGTTVTWKTMNLMTR